VSAEQTGLAAFTQQRYLSLETYRRTGQPVATPVWFVIDRNVIYVYSLANAGKVKRIRNNPRVRIAACDVRGALRGAWVDATARVVDEREAEPAQRRLRAKYGWQKRLLDLLRKARPKPRAVIAIRVKPLFDPS
jgi:PPOX class probable F420-dependent enzyme